MRATGNLADLGRDQDMVDAVALFDLLFIAKRHPASVGPGFSRRLIEDLWQTKRLYALPSGHAYGHRIYRKGLPWSPEAVARTQDAIRVGRGLILEHVIPMGITVKAVESASTADDVADVLRHHLILAVITKEQNQALARAGLASTHPDVTDPWSRYAAAGIDVAPFPTA